MGTSGAEGRGVSAFTKLDSGIVHSTIWVQPHDVLRTWIALLALADQHGIAKTAAPSLAHLCMIPLDRMRQIIAILESPDEDSRSEAEDGRRIVKVEGGWQLVNHAAYRNKRDPESDRDRKRAWDREHRPSGHARAQKSDTVRHSPTQSGDSPTSPTQAEAEADISPSLRSGDARKRAAPDRTITSIKGVSVPPRPDDAEPQAWGDWLGLRKAKSAPVTETVIEQARREAAKAGLTLTRFLEIWCARGSQGLQADWLKPNELSHARAGPNGAAPPSKTLTAIQKLQGMKRGDLDPQRDSGRPDQAALPGA